MVARREERLTALCDEVGGDAAYVVADLTDPAAAGKLAERVESDFGRLDLLVNNAGGNRTRGEFAELGYDYVREVMDQNFDSAVRVTEALLPILRRSAPSAIVNVGSIAGRIARPQVTKIDRLIIRMVRRQRPQPQRREQFLFDHTQNSAPLRRLQHRMIQ